MGSISLAIHLHEAIVGAGAIHFMLGISAAFSISLVSYWAGITFFGLLSRPNGHHDDFVAIFKGIKTTPEQLAAVSWFWDESRRRKIKWTLADDHDGFLVIRIHLIPYLGMLRMVDFRGDHVIFMQRRHRIHKISLDEKDFGLWKSEVYSYADPLMTSKLSQRLSNLDKKRWPHITCEWWGKKRLFNLVSKI